MAVWEWVSSKHQYRLTETGEYLTQSQMVVLRDKYLDGQIGIVERLATQYSNGSLSLREWQEAMKNEIRNSHISQYVVGHGGRDTMSFADWGRLGYKIREQYQYLERFARDLEGSKYIDPETGLWRTDLIANRAALYMKSGISSYERGHVLGMGMPDLPHYPGDGSSQCLCIATPESRVLTKERGWAPMNSVFVGEHVWTHKRRWRPVMGVVIKPSREYHRLAVIETPMGVVGATHDHRWYTSEGWRSSIDIGSASLLCYHHQDTIAQREGESNDKMLRVVWGEIEQSQFTNQVQKVLERLSLREPERFSSGRMSFMRDVSQGKGAVGEPQAASWDSIRPSQGGSEAADTTRGFGRGHDQLASEESGWSALHLVLGQRGQADDLSLPVGVVASQRADQERLRTASSGWRSDKRQFGQFGSDDRERPCAFTPESIQDNSRGEASEAIRVSRALSRSATQSLGDDCLPDVRSDVSSREGSWQVAQVLLAGMLRPTCLYDLTVSEDHSFCIEGVFAHNTNCRCAWDIETVSDDDGLTIGWNCWWVAADDAGTCEDCSGYASEYSPLWVPNVFYVGSGLR